MCTGQIVQMGTEAKTVQVTGQGPEKLKRGEKKVPGNVQSVPSFALTDVNTKEGRSCTVQ